MGQINHDCPKIVHKVEIFISFFFSPWCEKKNAEKIFAMNWRFFPTLDPQVDLVQLLWHTFNKHFFKIHSFFQGRWHYLWVKKHCLTEIWWFWMFSWSIICSDSAMVYLSALLLLYYSRRYYYFVFGVTCNLFCWPDPILNF